jgi:hypothetical protein
MAGRYFRTAGSPWNTPLPADAPISANSAAYVADLQRMRTAGSIWWINRDSFTTTVYEVTSATPTVQVLLIPTSAPYTPYAAVQGGDRFTEMAWRFQQGVPIPAGAVTSPGSDSQMTVFNTTTGEMWEMWVLEFNRTDRNAALAGKWSFMYGGYMGDHRQNIGQFQDGDIPVKTFAAWGATATSLPISAGLILNSELVANSIPHALQFIPPDPDAAFVWPAQRGDGYPGKVIPEGTIFRIKPDVDVSAYDTGDATTNARLRTIATAMRDYGLIVNDKTGLGQSLSLRAEPDPGNVVSWGGVGWQTMLATIPLTDFEVVDPAYRPAVALPPAQSSSTGPYWGVHG